MPLFGSVYPRAVSILWLFTPRGFGMASEAHVLLTELGARWLKKHNFGVISTELACSGARERPDVVGFRSDCSAIIEVKVSRADFFADRAKPERSSGGVGVYRFYLCPEGLLAPSDLPPRWGLLVAVGRKVSAVVAPIGNLWSPWGKAQPGSDWALFQHEPDIYAERQMLYSISRRLSSRRDQ